MIIFFEQFVRLFPKYKMASVRLFTCGMMYIIWNSGIWLVRVSPGSMCRILLKQQFSTVLVL